MSAPRTKRQFAGAASDPAQRHITSFFSSASSPNHNAIHQLPSQSQPYSSRADSASNLPATVQSNLLSVGMRIRKSVPEGYKTGNHCNAFALWDENDASDPATVASAISSNNMGEGQRSRANAFSSPRELLPFCGIHKVGGLDTQPGAAAAHQRPIQFIPPIHSSSIHANLPAAMLVAYQPSFGTEMSEDEEGVPGLTSSQESVGSNTSSSSDMIMASTRSRKRFFVEDEEGEIPGQLNLWRYNNSISSSDIHNNNNNNSLSPVNNGRAMAVPRKGRLRAKFAGTTTTSVVPGGAGQENLNLMAVDSDFEEAEFLDDQGTWEVIMNDA